MNTFIEFYNANRISILCFIIFLIIGFVIKLIKKILRRNRKNKELIQASEDRIRDENLNNVILNNYEGNTNVKEVYKPYYVDYGNSDNAVNSKGQGRNDKTQIMLQLVEKTELSTRKFMLNPAKKIHIGSDVKDNDITVLSEGVLPHHCEIFSIGSKVYIRKLDNGGRIIIRRKKNEAVVTGKSIRLLSDDIVIIGSVIYDITITS